MSRFTQRWECVNKCPPFETFTTPHYCPHCASKEVVPIGEEHKVYRFADEGYTNHGNNKN